MTVDPFFRHPIRTAKGGGTKCTTCEITTECHEAAKCIFPLLCVTMYLPSCVNPTLINASSILGTVQYDCDLQGWDLSVECASGYVIDFLLTYEEISGTPTAVLRSYFLGVEAMVPFTDAVNASCPSFEFDLGADGTVTTRPYDLVSVGQQKCVNSGPDDCTAGRCLPRYLCADVYTVARPEAPYHTELSWYTNDTVTIDDICCCSANEFPELLIARVINFSAGCTCIGPKRTATLYYTAEQAAADITDPGAILHLRHRVAYNEAFVTGYPNVPAGAHVWVSEGIIADDLVPVCPAPDQIETEYTLALYARLIVWCDPVTGTFQACFEIVNYTDSLAASNTEYLTPFKIANPYSSVFRITDCRILACNPFQVSLEGIYENNGNCQDTDNHRGTGVLKIHVGEFIGWVGVNPIDTERRITVYSERINTASTPQTLATDCLPKIHIQTAGDTYRERSDHFSITQIWPDHVFDHCEFTIGSEPPYHTISRIVIYPRSCTGCVTPPPIDLYSPITTRCCASPVPRTLYATAVEDNDCPCAGGTTVVLTYDDGEDAWYGTATFGTASGCGICTVEMRLSCSDLIGSAIWQLQWGYVGGGSFVWTPQAPANDPVYQCDPFLWITRGISSDSCCKPSFAASFFHWVITE